MKTLTETRTLHHSVTIHLETNAKRMTLSTTRTMLTRITMACTLLANLIRNLTSSFRETALTIMGFRKRPTLVQLARELQLALDTEMRTRIRILRSIKRTKAGRRSGGSLELSCSSSCKQLSRGPSSYKCAVLNLCHSGVVAGIVAWRVTVSNDDDNSSTSSGSSGRMQFIDGTAKVVRSDPGDPSRFETNPALKKSFWGMTYTPYLAQEPWCGITLANVTEDIQWLSQTTSAFARQVSVSVLELFADTLCRLRQLARLRMYGSGCNMSQITLQAIQDTKVDMQVWLGAYIGDNSTVNEQQKQCRQAFAPD